MDSAHWFCHVRLNSRYFLSAWFDTFPLTVTCRLSLSFPRMSSRYLIGVNGTGANKGGKLVAYLKPSRACVHSFPDPSIIACCFTSISAPLLDGQNIPPCLIQYFSYYSSIPVVMLDTCCYIAGNILSTTQHLFITNWIHANAKFCAPRNTFL